VHVLVATDGQLDPASVATYAAPLAGPDGRVTVMTAIAVPRRLLSELRSLWGEQPSRTVDGDAEYVAVARTGAEPFGWPGDDVMIERYLNDKRLEYTQPVVDALQAAGVAAEGKVVECEDVARSIIDVAASLGTDVVVIGSHGQGRFEGLLGSTGTTVTRRARVAVLVLRSNAD
jgi:nucleotide-binding universal stress UspA family protein